MGDFPRNKNSLVSLKRSYIIPGKSYIIHTLVEKMNFLVVSLICVSLEILRFGLLIY